MHAGHSRAVLFNPKWPFSPDRGLARMWMEHVTVTAFAHKLVLSSAREARTRKKIWLIAPFHNRGAALSPESLPMLCDPFIAFIQGIAAVCLLKELAHRGQETPPPPPQSILSCFSH